MHGVTFSLQRALLTTAGFMLLRYTGAHLLHVRWTFSPRTRQPLERETGQPWGKSSTSNEIKDDLGDQKHTNQAFPAAFPTAPQPFPCHRTGVFTWKEVTPFPQFTAHFTQGSTSSSEQKPLPLNVHLCLCVHKPFLPALFKSSQGDWDCGVFNLRLPVSHTNLGVKIRIHFLPFFLLLFF